MAKKPKKSKAKKSEPKGPPQDKSTPEERAKIGRQLADEARENKTPIR